ncbi:hypothetical protein ABTE40_20220, partial [Acinetobacter baumannii]
MDSPAESPPIYFFKNSASNAIRCPPISELSVRIQADIDYFKGVYPREMHDADRIQNALKKYPAFIINAITSG